MGIYDAGRGRLVPQSVGTPKGTALVERVDRGDHDVRGTLRQRGHLGRCGLEQRHEDGRRHLLGA